MARRTLLAGMCARQRKSRPAVIKHSTCPRRRAVTNCAILREAGCNVIRICCVVVARLVTGCATRRQTVVLTAAVACRALLAGVRPGQWKAARSVIKHGPCPRGCVVTNCAFLREAGRNVIRIRRVVVPRLMA